MEPLSLPPGSFCSPVSLRAKTLKELLKTKIGADEGASIAPRGRFLIETRSLPISLAVTSQLYLLCRSSPVAPFILHPSTFPRHCRRRSHPDASDRTILLLAINAASRGGGKLQEGPE